MLKEIGRILFLILSSVPWLWWPILFVFLAFGSTGQKSFLIGMTIGFCVFSCLIRLPRRLEKQAEEAKQAEELTEQPLDSEE